MRYTLKTSGTQISVQTFDTFKEAILAIKQQAIGSGYAREWDLYDADRKGADGLLATIYVSGLGSVALATQFDEIPDADLEATSDLFVPGQR